ncbi:MAG: asparagine synthase (glutamine-hydrolyzing) [Hyphomicrobiaceae bacterium]
MRTDAKKRLPSEEELGRMTDTLRHRGPDARGTWYQPDFGVGLGHRRLSIRDLSDAGAQPMTSSCGRYVFVYNGEVYSHSELSKELSHTGRTLKGHSDTEIILEAIAEWGVDRVLPKLIGMFAFALYDKKLGELILARDRLGQKPLYWANVDGFLIFGSELKALRALDVWHPQLDRNSLASFLKYNYIPSPVTIYKNVNKLAPGAILRMRPEGQPDVSLYWDLREIAACRSSTPFNYTQEEVLEQLDDLLGDAVRRRLVSDVPLGALLSGGIDSSLVTALMVEQSSQRVKTFSIGFDEQRWNEAPYARSVADHLGTDHTELYSTPGNALELVEQLPDCYDEPFADPSQLPTLLVCQLARENVKVVLSGDGPDEFFAGYGRYDALLNVWQNISQVPKTARKVMAHSLLGCPRQLLDRMTGLVPGRYAKNEMSAKLLYYARAAANDDPDVMNHGHMSFWQEPCKAVIGGTPYHSLLGDVTVRSQVPELFERMMLLDQMTFLPDDILTKLDRASMRFALEARSPMLDHRLVEFSWQLPRNMKIRDGVTKWALREILYKRIPQQLIDRPKMGFGVPLGAWLRGELRPWAEELLSADRLERNGVFQTAQIRKRWQAHLDGTDWSSHLWSVLMAQAWFVANPDVQLSA